MRNLSCVIKELLEQIPENEKIFDMSLKDVLSSVNCMAPEMGQIWWAETSKILQEFIPEKPIEEWHFKVLSIFSNEPIGKIKDFYSSQKLDMEREKL